MEVDLILTADAATIDGSGKLNLLGVFDQISVGRFPARHGRLSLVLRFLGGVGDAGTHKLTIKLSSPKGKELVSLSGELKVSPGRRSLETGIRVPHVINLDGIVFNEAGVHTFHILVDGRHQATLPLSIVSRGAGRAMA